MAERYLPVPVWNSRTGSWEPVDYRHGQRVVNWPDGFDPLSLPIPEYHDGDHIQFVRDETCAREGIVRRVLLSGEVYGLQEDLNEAIKRCYLDPENSIYIVTARGHDHRINAWNILGRFVSLERISSILPLREE